MSQIKILSCFIKEWEIPKSDDIMPIHGGKAMTSVDLHMPGDDTLDHISEKNQTFGEFTVWYWAWKNIKKLFPDLEYIGLAHYRRYFVLDKFSFQEVLKVRHFPDLTDYGKLCISELKHHDIILAKKMTYPYNLKIQYAWFHNSFDFQCVKEIVHEICPEYDDSFRTVLGNSNSMSCYCFFVSRYELFDRYFSWLFPILFEAEKRIDVSKYPLYQKRVFAFLAERLINVYVYHHKLKVSYKPVYFMVGENERTDVGNISAVSTAIKKIVKFFIPCGIYFIYRCIRAKIDKPEEVEF